MVEEGVDRHRVAVHDREDPLGQAGLPPQVGDEERRRRVALGGLEDEGVAAGDGHRVHPHGHHDREIERGDARHHAQRLADRRRVDPVGDVLGELPLQQMGYATGELDHLDAARHLAEGVLGDLAVLGGDQPGEVLPVAVGQIAEAEQDAGPGGERRVAPFGERGRCRATPPVRRPPPRPAPPPPSGSRSPGRTPARCGPVRPRAMVPILFTRAILLLRSLASTAPCHWCLSVVSLVSLVSRRAVTRHVEESHHVRTEPDRW